MEFISFCLIDAIEPVGTHLIEMVRPESQSREQRLMFPIQTELTLFG